MVTKGVVICECGREMSFCECHWCEGDGCRQCGYVGGYYKCTNASCWEDAKEKRRKEENDEFAR